MGNVTADTGYGIYWTTWGILLSLTAIMLLAEWHPFSRTFVIALLLVAMMIKAFLIAGQFMHLRFEKPGLVAAVAGTILFLSAFLFIVLSFDGRRIFEMVTR